MTDSPNPLATASLLDARADEIIPGVAQAGALPASDALVLRDWFDRQCRGGAVIPTADSRRRREKAARIVRELRETTNLQAAVLYGSAAAGSATAHSDIDLLLIFAAPKPGWRELIQRVPALTDDDVEARFYTFDRLRDVGPSQWAYLQHIRRNHLVLAWHPDLIAALDPPAPTGARLAEDLRAWVDRYAGAILTDPDYWKDSRDRGVRADLFVVSRSAIMLANAHRGIFDPSRARAFDLFAGRHPDLTAAVDTIRAAEADWRTGRRPGEWPASDLTVSEVIAAANRIIDAACAEMEHSSPA